jgi:hypothetical protein
MANEGLAYSVGTTEGTPYVEYVAGQIKDPATSAQLLRLHRNALANNSTGNLLSRMLKKSETALLVETKARLYVSAYARNRYPTKFDVQLPIAGRACTCKPSVAAHSADGR